MLWLAVVLVALATFELISSTLIGHAAPPWLAVGLAAIAAVVPLVWHLLAERSHKQRSAGARRSLARQFVISLLVFGPLFVLDAGVVAATRQHGLWWLPREPAPPVTPTPPAPRPPPAPTGIVARTTPPELAFDDGEPILTRPLAQVTDPPLLPADLSPLAELGRIDVPQTNTAILFDTTDGRPFFIHDENYNKDLRDDPRRSLARRGETWQRTVPAEAPFRIRVHGPVRTIQDRVVRHGELPIGDDRLTFALVGSYGDYASPFDRIAIDLDRDATLRIDDRDGPEVFYVSEKTVNIDERSYVMHVDPHGEYLNLVPLDQRLPDRAPLRDGTPAPPFTGAGLHGSEIEFPRGRITLLDLWSYTCHYCIESVPTLEALAREHPLLDILIIADSDAATAGPALSRAPPPNLLQIVDGKPIHDLYRVHGTPRYLLVDHLGVIACADCGLADVRTRLPRLLAP